MKLAFQEYLKLGYIGKNESNLIFVEGMAFANIIIVTSLELKHNGFFQKQSAILCFILLKWI